MLARPRHRRWDSAPADWSFGHLRRRSHLSMHPCIHASVSVHAQPPQTPLAGSDLGRNLCHKLPVNGERCFSRGRGSASSAPCFGRREVQIPQHLACLLLRDRPESSGCRAELQRGLEKMSSFWIRCSSWGWVGASRLIHSSPESMFPHEAVL